MYVKKQGLGLCQSCRCNLQSLCIQAQKGGVSNWGLKQSKYRHEIFMVLTLDRSGKPCL